MIVKSTLKCRHTSVLDTDCELIWVTLKILNKKIIYICAYYRRHVYDEESLRYFESSIFIVSNIPNSSISIGEDVNFPSWDWKGNTINEETKYAPLHYEESSKKYNRSHSNKYCQSSSEGRCPPGSIRSWYDFYRILHECTKFKDQDILVPQYKREK